MADQERDFEAHLTDAELFSLAVPPTGEPEALPQHLSRCRDCSRALQQWQAAVRALADEDTGVIDRRTPEEWRSAEEATLAALRRAGRPGRRAHPMRWAVAVAASLLLAALVLPVRHGGPAATAAPTPAAQAATSELSPADRADDEMLREASFLAGGGDDLADAALEGRL
jgi:hypothetical protein